MPRITATFRVPDPLPVGVHFLVSLLQPEDQLTGEAITGGATIIRVRNAAGDVIGHGDAVYQSEPFPGGFHGGFGPLTLSLTAGAVYFVEMTLTSPDGITAFWRVRRTAAYE